MFAAYANTPIGRVVRVRGSVLKIHNKISESLKNGDDIYQGDLIESLEASFIKILMKDDTLFQLGPMSKFQFEKFVMKNKESRETIYNLLKGQMRGLFQKKTKEKTLKVKTPTASLAVRGTEILADVYTVENNIISDVALLSGEMDLEIKPTDGPPKIIKFLPGEYCDGIHSGTQEALMSLKKRKIPNDSLESLMGHEVKRKNLFLFEALKKYRPNRFLEKVRFEQKKPDQKIYENQKVDRKLKDNVSKMLERDLRKKENVPPKKHRNKLRAPSPNKSQILPESENNHDIPKLEDSSNIKKNIDENEK